MAVAHKLLQEQEQEGRLWWPAAPLPLEQQVSRPSLRPLPLFQLLLQVLRGHLSHLQLQLQLLLPVLHRHHQSQWITMLCVLLLLALFLKPHVLLSLMWPQANCLQKGKLRCRQMMILVVLQMQLVLLLLLRVVLVLVHLQ